MTNLIVIKSTYQCSENTLDRGMIIVTFHNNDDPAQKSGAGTLAEAADVISVLAEST